MTVKHGWNLTNLSTEANAGGFEFVSRANFYYAYSTLVLYSFGLENAIEVSRSMRKFGRRLTIANEDGYPVLSHQRIRVSHRAYTFVLHVLSLTPARL